MQKSVVTLRDRRFEQHNFVSNTKYMATKNVGTNFKWIILMFVCFVFGFNGNSAYGQSEFPTTVSYRGLEGSFGRHTFTINSNIKELRRLSAVMDGGEIGLVYGNETIRGRLVLFGYYFSTGSMSGSMDLYNNSGSLNFYPLTLFTSEKPWVSPYFVGGIAYTQIKYYGYYLRSDKVVTPVNYSRASEPFLGKVNQMNGYIGGGFDFILKDHFDFVHLFAEAKYGFGLSEKTRQSDFIATSSSSQIVYSIGIRFGAKR